VTASAAATPDPPPAADVHPPAGPAIASYRIPSHTSVIEVLRRPVESAHPSARPRQDSPTTAPAVTDANVARSVLAATQALDHLERSLRAGGFVEGTSAYERMAEVLLAQRLWHGSSDRRLADDFQRLGKPRAASSGCCIHTPS
jgi:hypothetical protein